MRLVDVKLTGLPVPVVGAYDGAGSHLATVVDQEITVFLVWAVAGVCFIPVIVVMGLTWLMEGAEPAGRTAPAGVRGLGRVSSAGAAAPRPRPVICWPR